METLAIVILGFYAVGYFVLGGADIGAGMLIPVLARDRRERRLMVATIVPFFLTNEVWLIATAGVLIGLFPVLEGDLLSGLFPLFVVVLAGWVGRDAGVWFRGRVDGDGRGSRAWRAGCDATIVAGSWLVAAGWGWIFAGLLTGTTDRVVTEPAVLVAVAAVVTVFALHGLAFVALRSSGDLRRRSLQLFGASGERRTFTVTSLVMAAFVVVAGSNLALTDTVAEAGTLAWLVPAILGITPLLLAGQVWAWWLFGRRIPAPLPAPVNSARGDRP